MSEKDGLYLAKGHIAKVIQFDEKTVLVPLNENESSRLLNLVNRQMAKLEETKDFPERAEYENLKYNLYTALMHTMQKGS
jgi:hypothetical protein